MPTPTRDVLTDDTVEVLRFAIDSFRDCAVALATLVEIRGGAARALGSHVAVAADGRFCGYVSGGCVEAAVASEALLAMAKGRDRTVMFGEGSPFFDIVLPCGGGITIAIHVLREVGSVECILSSLQQRRSAGLQCSPERQSLATVDQPQRTGWQDKEFLTVYRPHTRLVVSGQTVEAQTVARLADACGYEVHVGEPSDNGMQLGNIIDHFTAVVLLHHGLEQEAQVLDAALQSSAFYIGALGSTRTHCRRVERLRALGREESDTNRIRAPIGIFGPTKDSASLALSVLADIAACRMTKFC
jgi:xanthine dehydrogenase accessory factor